MPETERYLALSQLHDPSDPFDDCYVCARMRLRKPEWRQPGLSETCLLCNNRFCEKHKSPDGLEGVCEMNHQTYCSKQTHKEFHAPVKIFVSLEARREALGREVDC